ncbi:hypothetical protein C7212DRAFT_367061 [Tuber magnatum]|uniref:CNNM transmembrane domain-containing protein n=1 Tax=Tuber magnatum TaxID=42249 RepID=A0A317SEV4_9PEZI|nr:hypothetical protein C7212DRAFT_367061 [Tuber magnatum]
MNARKIIYAEWLSVAIPLLCLLLWTITSSTAYPCLRRRNYLHPIEPIPIQGPKPHELKGPLWCDGVITADRAAGERAYVCEGQTLCKGATSCDGPLICIGSWFDDEGMLASLDSVTINLSLPLISACLLDNHLWGLLLSAGLLVAVGEILPQVIFPRYPVVILGNLVWVMQGALDLDNRVAGDIMKPISDVKMLDVKDRVNIDRWKTVINWGYKLAVLLVEGILLIAVQDMMSADPNEVTTLRSVPIHALPIVSGDYPLWDLLHLFQGGFSHIAIVEKTPPIGQKTQNNTPVDNAPPNWVWGGIRDGICRKLKFIRNGGNYQQPVTQTPKYWTDSPIYKLSREQPLGIVTMEDVLKALLRSPIFDEKDISHYKRRREYGDGSPGGVLESELQSPFSRESPNSQELETGSHPAGPAIQFATRNGDKSLDIAARRKHNSRNEHLSCSKPLVPLSNRGRRGKSLSDPLGRTLRCNSPKGFSPKDKGRGKAGEVGKAMSENNYSTNASDGFELESLTGTSIPSSIFSHSTGTTSHSLDLLGLRGESTDSSDPGLSTLEEEFSASVHSI